MEIKKTETRDERLERQKRLARYRVEKIPKEYLIPLVEEYKKIKLPEVAARKAEIAELKKKKIPVVDRNLKYKRVTMPSELAEVLEIIVDKTLGGPSWRRYSSDWKEGMKDRAIEHLLRYSHNFDVEKCKDGNDDPYNYFAMVASRAFTQTLNKLKPMVDIMIPLNHDVLYNEDQFEKFSEQIREDHVTVVDPDITSLDWGQSL